MGLAKFDDQAVQFSLPRIETGMLLPLGRVQVQRYGCYHLQRGNFPLGGQIRCWKILARELAATMKEGGPFSAKCGSEEGMEVEEELVPTKRLCVGEKNFETVEAVDQPHRE